MGDKGNTTSSRIELSPEARTALTGEIGTFVSTLAPQQGQIQDLLLDQLQPGNSDLLSQNVVRSLGLANAATNNAGAGAGVSSNEINETVQNLGNLEPAALGQLEQFAQNFAGQQDSVVDPRFAFALRPDQVTNTSPGSGQQAAQAAQLAIAVGGILAAS